MKELQVSYEAQDAGSVTKIKVEHFSNNYSADVPRTYEESRRCYKISSRQDNENVLEIVSCWFSRKNESKL